MSTLLAPIATPALLYLLAGQWLPVNFVDMFTMIVQVIVIPVIAGLLINRFLPKIAAKTSVAMPLVSVLAILAILSAVVAANTGSLIQAGLIALLP